MSQTVYSKFIILVSLGNFPQVRNALKTTQGYNKITLLRDFENQTKVHSDQTRVLRKPHKGTGT